MSLFDFFDHCKEAMDDCMDWVTDNPVKTVFIIGATVATGGAALAYAPAIAGTLGGAGILGVTATTGTPIVTLSGAALTNASLAACGGGALAAGGAGMAGGTAVITTVGTVLGAGASGAAAKVAS